MPAGFQVIGDHGGIQIDENFANLSFISKNTLDFSATPGLSFSFTGDTPIVCFSANGIGSRISVLSVTRNGNIYTYNVRAPQGTVATYYIFDKTPNVSAPVGLTVYDEAGRVTFNSDYKPMKVAHMHKIPDGVSNPNTENNYVPAPTGAGTYAACLSFSKYWLAGPISQTNPQFVIYASGVYTDSTGAGMALQPISTLIPGDAFGAQPLGGTLIIADVAGL